MFDRSSNTPNLENVYGLTKLNEMSDRSKKNFLLWSFLGVTTGTIIY